MKPKIKKRTKIGVVARDLKDYEYHTSFNPEMEDDFVPILVPNHIQARPCKCFILTKRWRENPTIFTMKKAIDAEVELIKEEEQERRNGAHVPRNHELGEAKWDFVKAFNTLVSYRRILDYRRKFNANFIHAEKESESEVKAPKVIPNNIDYEYWAELLGDEDTYDTTFN